MFAHVKWFNSETLQQVPTLSSTEIAWGILLFLGGLAILMLADKFLEPHLKLPFKAKTLIKDKKYIPAIVRISAGLLLTINVLSGSLYAPNVSNSWEGADAVIGAAMLVIGIMLLLGVYVRVIGIAMVALFFASMWAISPVIDVLDHAEYIGIGLYLAYAGGGPFCLLPASVIDVKRKYIDLAPRILMFFVGLDLVILGFSEKLANMPAALDFLNQHDWNFLSGVGLSNRYFVIFVAIVELMIGLTLILNKSSRAGSLLLLLTMISTAALLGVEEIYGHLFAVGIVAIVWLLPIHDNKYNLSRL
ncbi:MAG: hypothetical protein M3P98_00295 [bacterium]|nr:hypothetical protein [bacterium]